MIPKTVHEETTSTRLASLGYDSAVKSPLSGESELKQDESNKFSLPHVTDLASRAKNVAVESLGERSSVPSKTEPPKSILAVTNTQELAQFILVKPEDKWGEQFVSAMVDVYAEEEKEYDAFQVTDEISQLICKGNSLSALEKLLNCLFTTTSKKIYDDTKIINVLIKLQQVYFEKMLINFRSNADIGTSNLPDLMVKVNATTVLAKIKSLMEKINELNKLSEFSPALVEYIKALAAILDLYQERGAAVSSFAAVAGRSGSTSGSPRAVGASGGSSGFASVDVGAASDGAAVATRKKKLKKGPERAASGFAGTPIREVDTLAEAKALIRTFISSPYIQLAFLANYANVHIARKGFRNSLVFTGGNDHWHGKGGYLILYEMALVSPNSHFLHLLNALLENRDDLPESVSTIDFRNTFIIFGFVKILWRVLELGECNAEVQEQIINVFELIIIVNADEAPKGNFAIKEKHKDEILKKIGEYLFLCSEHQNQNIRGFAVWVLGNDKIKPFLPKEPISKKVPQPTLFDRAKGRVPLFNGLQQARHRMLQDDHLTRASSYTMEQTLTLREVESKRNWAGSLDKRMSTFLESRKMDAPAPMAVRAAMDFPAAMAAPAPMVAPAAMAFPAAVDSHPQMLSVEGSHGGEEVTLGMKVFTAKLLEHYDDTCYFPFYVALPRLKDPIKGAINETLEEFGIREKDKDELKLRRVLYIFDGMDHLYNVDSRQAKLNLWKTNNLEEWPNAKCVFIFRLGLFSRERIEPSRGIEWQRLQLDPFDQNAIRNFVKAFVKETKMQPAWTVAEYIEALSILRNLGCWEMLISSFSLKAILQFLPKIIVTDPSMDWRHAIQGMNLDAIFLCYLSCNAVRASLITNKYTPMEFVNYALDIAATMQHLSIKIINFMGFISQKKIEVFFTSEKEPFYKECLIKSDDGWRFITEGYQFFLASLKTDSGKLKKVEAGLKDYEQFVRMELGGDLVRPLNTISSISSKSPKEGELSTPPSHIEVSGGGRVNVSGSGISVRGESIKISPSQETDAAYLIKQLEKLGYDVSQIKKKDAKDTK